MTKDQKNKLKLDRQSDYFEGDADPEELAHLQDLIDKSTNKELAALARKVGIKFFAPDKKINRQEYKIVIDESTREDFY